MTLHEFMCLLSEDMPAVVLEAWYDSGFGDVTYEDLIPEGPEDDCAEQAERRLKLWFWVNFLDELPDPLDTYAYGFTDSEEERLSQACDTFVYLACEAIEEDHEYAMTLASLPR